MAAPAWAWRSAAKSPACWRRNHRGQQPGTASFTLYLPLGYSPTGALPPRKPIDARPEVPAVVPLLPLIEPANEVETIATTSVRRSGAAAVDNDLGSLKCVMDTAQGEGFKVLATSLAGGCTDDGQGASTRRDHARHLPARCQRLARAQPVEERSSSAISRCGSSRPRTICRVAGARGGRHAMNQSRRNKSWLKPWARFTRCSSDRQAAAVGHGEFERESPYSRGRSVHDDVVVMTATTPDEVRECLEESGRLHRLRSPADERNWQTLARRVRRGRSACRAAAVDPCRTRNPRGRYKRPFVARSSFDVRQIHSAASLVRPGGSAMHRPVEHLPDAAQGIDRALVQ